MPHDTTFSTHAEGPPSALILVGVCDVAGQFTRVNLAGAQLLGYPSEAALLAAPGPVPHAPALAAADWEALRAEARRTGHHAIETEVQQASGATFEARIELTYVEAATTGYFVVRLSEQSRPHQAERELAELAQRQAELAQALAAEQELGELKSRFVSMASHEFRTPLTAVLTSATLIEQYPATEQQDKRLRHLDRIRQSVKQLNDILEEFLSVGRIEEGKVTTHPGHLNLPLVLRDVLADLQGLLKPGQQVVQTIDCTEPMWLDASLLRKILVNLLSNASKYSAADTVMQVQATGRAGRLTLVVQDAGVGISPEDQARLFERFFRARNVTNVPGTGLGLYIVGRYVDLLRGTIKLASELDKGTAVTIVIPYENAAAN